MIKQEVTQLIICCFKERRFAAAPTCVWSTCHRFEARLRERTLCKSKTRMFRKTARFLSPWRGHQQCVWCEEPPSWGWT